MLYESHIIMQNRTSGIEHMKTNQNIFLQIFTKFKLHVQKLYCILYTVCIRYGPCQFGSYCEQKSFILNLQNLQRIQIKCTTLSVVQTRVGNSIQLFEARQKLDRFLALSSIHFENEARNLSSSLSILKMKLDRYLASARDQARFPTLLSISLWSLETEKSLVSDIFKSH